MNVAAAARILGISRQALHRRLRADPISQDTLARVAGATGQTEEQVRAWVSAEALRWGRTPPRVQCGHTEEL